MIEFDTRASSDVVVSIEDYVKYSEWLITIISSQNYRKKNIIMCIVY